MSKLIEYANNEFRALGYKPIEGVEDGPEKWIQENVMELLQIFDSQGHSGASATHCIAMFSSLSKFEPLSPLTGEPDEWNEVGPGVFQNKRCSRVFRRSDMFDGQAYDVAGLVFKNSIGDYFTNVESFVPITFPYVPKTEYVDLDVCKYGDTPTKNWFARLTNKLKQYFDKKQVNK